MKIGDLVRCVDPHCEKNGSLGLIVDYEIYYSACGYHGTEGWWVSYFSDNGFRNWQSPEDLEVINANR